MMVRVGTSTYYRTPLMFYDNNVNVQVYTEDVLQTQVVPFFEAYEAITFF